MSALEKFGTETRLMENQLYTVTLNVSGETSTFSFTSRYTPLYSTVKLVKSEFNRMFSVFSDDEINQLIQSNSILALEFANPAIDTQDDIPYYVKQYVRYKTQLDLITSLLIERSSQAGSSEKRLADLNIVKEYKTPELEGILKIIERRLAPWEAQLSGMKARPTGSIRSGNTEYPIGTRLF